MTSILQKKRKFINLLADEIITRDDYHESVEAINLELNELIKQKNELMESENTIEILEKLKKELLQFLNFDELTEDMLHRLIDRIEVKADGSPIIYYRFSTPKIE